MALPPIQIVHTLVIAWILAGVSLHHHRRLHVAMMACAPVLDLGMVLWLEFDRDVLARAAVAASWLLRTHIGLAVLTFLAYGITLRSGWRFLKTGQGLDRHRWRARLFLALRLAVYLTSFGVVS